MRKKYEIELAWQREWAPLFAANKDKCLQYWRNYRHLSDILEVIQIGSLDLVIDVGCGISSILHWLPGFTLGIDPLIGEYKKFYDYPFVVFEEAGEDMEPPKEVPSADVVFCTNCLDHVDDPEAVIQNISCMLKPGGYFVLTCEIYSRHKNDPAHPHNFAYLDIWKMVEKAGFKRVKDWIVPWVGLRRFVEGQLAPFGQELILVVRKEADNGKNGEQTSNAQT